MLTSVQQDGVTYNEAALIRTQQYIADSQAKQQQSNLNVESHGLSSEPEVNEQRGVSTADANTRKKIV